MNSTPDGTLPVRTYMDRFQLLTDAVDGIDVDKDDVQWLAWVAQTNQSTYAALALIGKLRRGAYPDINADRRPTSIVRVDGELVEHQESAGGTEQEPIDARGSAP